MPAKLLVQKQCLGIETETQQPVQRVLDMPGVMCPRSGRGVVAPVEGATLRDLDRYLNSAFLGLFYTSCGPRFSGHGHPARCAASEDVWILLACKPLLDDIRDVVLIEPQPRRQVRRHVLSQLESQEVTSVCNG
jgi:hypothetical protein